VQATGGHEVRRLKFPVGVGAVDDLEPERQPLDGLERGRGLGDAIAERGFHLEDDLGFDLRRDHAGERERGLVRLRVAHGVVVHVCPDERVELQHPPHRLVGVADLDADGPASSRAAHLHQLPFDEVRRGEIEAGAARSRWRDELAAGVRTGELGGERGRLDHAGTGIFAALAFAVACAARSP
jgi:hypothetical protein